MTRRPRTRSARTSSSRTDEGQTGNPRTRADSGTSSHGAKRNEARYEHWLLGLFAALLVTRPLVPLDVATDQMNGVLIGMLWIVLLVGWLAVGAQQREVAIRFTWTDTLVFLFLIWHTGSALLAAQLGNPRGAINAAWIWIELGLVFFLARQLITSAVRARSVIAVMISLSVGLALVGLYQQFVTLPQDRAVYESIKHDPAAMMRAVGQWFPEGSSEAQQFENRLYSNEPIATFALTNSLAGLLAVWLVAAIALLRFRSIPAGAIKGLAALVGLIPIGVCLALTKSRSAFVAVAFALVAIVWFARRYRSGTGTLRFRLAAVLLLIIAGAAIASGKIDRQVFTEAGKSLGYRLQYWQSTAAMIRAEPLQGCGPGQFQNAYTAFKLPEASEEIREPHNWVLEIAATSGLPALLLLLGVFISTVMRLGRADAVGFGAARDPRDEAPAGAAIRIAAVLGIALGAGIAALEGHALSFEGILILIIAMLLGTLFLRGAASANQLPALVAPVAAGTLLIHWLAAGGISDPGVAGSFWILIAITISQSQRPHESRRISPHVAAIAVAVSLLVGVIYYVTVYRPILRGQALHSQATDAWVSGSTDKSLQLFTEAQAADPYSPRLALMLAARRFDRWLAAPSDTTLEAFRTADERARQLDPKSSTIWLTSGRWHRQIFQQTRQPEDVERSLAALARAVELYPNDAERRIELAITLQAADQPSQAAQQAQVALQLDDITIAAGHNDRRLPPGLRQAAETLAAGAK